MSGVILIDKDAGWTSFDVCAKLRGVLGEKKIGHGGTLDPMATGLLPVFVGREATKHIDKLPGDKTYRGVVRLGITTNTDDITGEVLSAHEINATEAQVTAAAEKFRGETDQVPPMFSAIKIDGKTMYKLARKGEKIDIPPRKVTIYDIAVKPLSPTDYELFVHCSKGTYIRALARDIGAALGCGGALAALRRESVGRLSVADAVKIADASQEKLLPLSKIFGEIT